MHKTDTGGQCYKKLRSYLRCYLRNSVKIIEKYAASGVITAVKSLQYLPRGEESDELVKKNSDYQVNPIINSYSISSLIVQ